MPFESISGLEQQLNKLADETFGSMNLTPETEFHAMHIYAGKGAFKGVDVQKRVSVLKSLAEVITSDPDVKRVYASINTARLKTQLDPAKAAFVFFLEKVQSAIGKEGKTLLIGDFDNEGSKQMIRDFSTYRASGKTPWDYGTPIPKVVDAVHFAQSHHSRMIQLADAYLYLMTHQDSGRKGWQAEALTKELDGVELWPHRYKEWPKGLAQAFSPIVSPPPSATTYQYACPSRRIVEAAPPARQCSDAPFSSRLHR